MVLKSFDQGSALFILVEAPPFDLLEIKILFQNNTFSKTGATRVLSLFFAWDTPNQTPSSWWNYSKLLLWHGYSKLLLLGGDSYAGPGPALHAAA